MSVTEDSKKLSNFLKNCFLRGFKEYLHWRHIYVLKVFDYQKLTNLPLSFTIKVLVIYKDKIIPLRK